MCPSIRDGNIITCRKVPVDSVHPGDVLAVKLEDQIIFHRLMWKKQLSNRANIASNATSQDSPTNSLSTQHSALSTSGYILTLKGDAFIRLERIRWELDFVGKVERVLPNNKSEHEKSSGATLRTGWCSVLGAFFTGIFYTLYRFVRW